MSDEIKSLVKLTKNELKEKLLSLGYTMKQLCNDNDRILARPLLLEKLKEHYRGDKSLEVLPSIEEDKNDNDCICIDESESNKTIIDKDGNNQIEKIPTQNDDGWTQYVLYQFASDEMDGKNPRVEGLRRVAGKLIGEIQQENCDLVAAPSRDNDFRACAKASILFLTHEGKYKKFEALADAHIDNCVDDYATYLVAMADTRAKGRAFRNALGLRRVVAAEELNTIPSIIQDVQSDGVIQSTQISLIRILSERYNISIADILNEMEIPYKLNDSNGEVNLQSLLYKDASKIIKQIRLKRKELMNNGK